MAIESINNNESVSEASLVSDAPIIKTKKQGNKDLAKTRLCSFGINGQCHYGAECIFAHSVTELRSAPDLKKTQICSEYMAGKCTNDQCTFAHGEEELRDRPNFKLKTCKWFSKGMCRNGAKCGFAHGGKELRGAPPPEPSPNKVIAPPPGLSLVEEEPQEPEKQEPPEKSYFHLMAARGAAPLEKQVECMSSAIAGLQAKLAQLEGMMMHTQVAQMQQSILELSQQCQVIEANVGSTKSRLNAKAAPFVPTCEWGSDDSTSVGSE